MKLKVEINMENAAFDFPGTELARLLQYAADSVDGEDWCDLEYFSLALMDHNGNRVGTVFTEGTDERCKEEE